MFEMITHNHLWTQSQVFLVVAVVVVAAAVVVINL